jgi:3-oxoadipate enol-lactonase
MKQLKVNGISFCISQMGPKNAPKVLLSNSLGADLSMWDAQVNALSKKYRVISYDTRGHGNTEASEGDYSIELLADDVLCIMDEIGVEKAHFVGLSLGGLIGQFLGAHSSDRFESLTLCATFAASPRQIWIDRIKAVSETGIHPIADETMQRWFTKKYLLDNPKIISHVKNMFLTTSTNGYMGCAAAIRDMDLSGIPEQIPIPTLLISGSQDPSATPDMMKYLHNLIEGSIYKEIEQAAHLLTLEEPKIVNKLILDFINKIQSNKNL